MFSVAERVDMLREVTKKWDCVRWTSSRAAGGLRPHRGRGCDSPRDSRHFPTTSTNFQMALMNRKLVAAPGTVFMLPGEAYSYLSAKIVGRWRSSAGR